MVSQMSSGGSGCALMCVCVCVQGFIQDFEFGKGELQSLEGGGGGTPKLGVDMEGIAHNN